MKIFFFFSCEKYEATLCDVKTIWDQNFYTTWTDFLTVPIPQTFLELSANFSKKFKVQQFLSSFKILWTIIQNILKIWSVLTAISEKKFLKSYKNFPTLMFS